MAIAAQVRSAAALLARALSTPRVKALLALIAFLALLGLGIAARTTLVTRHDLHVDMRAEALRSPISTAFALAATSAASEAIGIGVLLVAVALLFVRRRRWDALRLFGAVGAAWALGLLVKVVIDRARPPAALWLLRPDSADSFPSGHDTTACVMIVIALVVFRGMPRLRFAAVAVAVVFAVAVGVSRIYLGDHYPTDVVGSWLTVAAAALAVWALTDLEPIRRLGARLLHDPQMRLRPA